MESTQPSHPSQRLSSTMSPLKQHPISPSFPPTTPDATQTIFLNHPSARLSSSPASSPRIIDPPPTRRGSVHPTMSKTMELGVNPGVDFFDDDSSGSEWEDSEGDLTHNVTAGEGLGLGSLVHGLERDDERASRGRSRDRNTMTALPSFHAPPGHADSGLGISSPMDYKRSRRARPMSVTRLGKDAVHVVHTRSNTGTPRDSLRSADSDAASPIAELHERFPNVKSSENTFNRPRSTSLHGHERSNTSESLIADSIINAHVTTMRALEALNVSPSRSIASPIGRSFFPSGTPGTSVDLPRFTSFTNNRHITLSPLTTLDHDRPAHLPSHFIKTPYPFTAKKEFPKPKQRPRQSELTRLDSGYNGEVQQDFEGRKGKHVLGLVTSDGDIDLRSRLERNEDAQGVIRSRANSGIESKESIVWLSLKRRTWGGRNRSQTDRKLVRIDVPSNLITRSPDLSSKKRNQTEDIEFDDKIFAQRLRVGHRTLAGSWFSRTFSARKLRHIQLDQTSTWSGTLSLYPGSCTISDLLAIGEGTEQSSDTRPPFTEQGLMKLFQSPPSGQARYTWVHWARRVAASNNGSISSPICSHPPTRGSHRRARSLDSPAIFAEKSAFSSYSDDEPVSAPSPDSITTIQFVHSLSTFRVLLALIMMLALSMLAAVLWVFLGKAKTGSTQDVNSQRSDRVGPAMAIGILVFLIESSGFGAWVWMS